MNIGSQVTGRDMNGKEINNGVIESVVKTFGVAIVRTGEDRINVSTAYVTDLEELK